MPTDQFFIGSGYTAATVPFRSYPEDKPLLVNASSQTQLYPNGNVAIRIQRWCSLAIGNVT